MLFDRAAADISDSDDETAIAAPVDIFMLEKAQAACICALKNCGVFPETTDQKVLKWLQHLKAADTFANGDICLGRDCVKHGVSVSGDVLERSTRNVSTTLEVQENLLQTGWRFVSDFRKASVFQKKAFAENPASYYALVAHFADSLMAYEEEDSFHHKQSDQYYKTIETALIHLSEQVEEVPTYKPAAFYTQLQNFWLGNCSKDPRLEFADKPRCRLLRYQSMF